MIQLLNKSINTVFLTNTVLRNIKEDDKFIILRNDKINTESFSKLSIFKDLVLDLTRQVNAESIEDIAILILKAGENIILNKVENRLILCLENCSTFSHENKIFTPSSGDLIWLNEDVNIINTEDSLTVLLVIDFKEFLL